MSEIFDPAHNNADKKALTELAYEIVIYAWKCKPFEIQGCVMHDEATIVGKIGSTIASLAGYPRLPIIGEIQFTDAINAVVHRIVHERISKKDSVEKLLALLEEIGCAIDNIPREQIERTVSFLEKGDERRAYNAIKPV